MGSSSKNRQDERVRDAYSTWNKVDEVDVKILEGLSMLGPRNLALISKHLDLPTTTVRYRVKRMLDDSILFLHLNPFHTNMGLRKAVLFIEADKVVAAICGDAAHSRQAGLFITYICIVWRYCESLYSAVSGLVIDSEEDMGVIGTVYEPFRCSRLGGKVVGLYLDL